MSINRKFMRLIHSIALAAFVVLAFRASASAADEPVVLFHLPFDGDLKAKTIKGAASPVRFPEKPLFATGKNGLALILFNDKAWHLVYETRRNLNMSSGTVAFWIKPLAVEKKARNHAEIFRTGDENGLNMIRLRYASPTRERNGKFYGCLMAKRLRRTLLQVCSWRGSAEKDWKTGEWHHIMLVWDDLRGVALFFDGQSVVGPPTNNGPFVFFDMDAEMSLGPASVALDDFIIMDRPITPAVFADLTGTEYNGEPSKVIEYKYVE